MDERTIRIDVCYENGDHLYKFYFPHNLDKGMEVTVEGDITAFKRFLNLDTVPSGPYDVLDASKFQYGNDVARAVADDIKNGMGKSMLKKIIMKQCAINGATGGR